MTRDDMETIVEYYLGDVNTKAVLEDTDIQASPREVEAFMSGVAWYVERGIREGVFVV